MAQLVTANPKLFFKSTDQELSESVVKVSGNSKFTRLDVREQCLMALTFLRVLNPMPKAHKQSSFE